MKSLSKVSFSVLSVFVFDIVSAGSWADLAMDIQNGKVNVQYEVKKGASDTSIASKAVNKGKEVVNDVKDASEKKGGLFGLFGGKKSKDKTGEASTSEGIENSVKDLGKKAEGEAKKASDKVEDKVKKVSGNVKENIDEAVGNLEDNDEEIINVENGSKPGFFSRLFGRRLGEDDTLAESSASEDGDEEDELSEKTEHLLDDREVVNVD